MDGRGFPSPCVGNGELWNDVGPGVGENAGAAGSELEVVADAELVVDIVLNTLWNGESRCGQTLSNATKRTMPNS